MHSQCVSYLIDYEGSQFDFVYFEPTHHFMTNVVSTPTVEGGVPMQSSRTSSQITLENPE